MNIIDQIDSVENPRPKAVCFDLGGVLVDIHRNWEDALHAAGLRNGVIGTLDAFPKLDSFQIGAIAEDEYFSELKEFLRIDSPDLARHVHNLILKEPYPGTLELIEELHHFGIITGCLSNTNEVHWQEMKTSGRFPNVEALRHPALSQELQLQKPDPPIFQAFENLTGMLPRQIVFFDDTEDHVDAALERGWRAFWIDPMKDTAEQMELLLISEGVLPAP